MLRDNSLFNVDRYGWLWLLLFGVVLLAAGIGLRDPWPADEPRFALVAKEMLESGQWLFPMRGGEIYPDKPPMFMWLISLSFLLTGSLKIAFLLPSLPPTAELLLTNFKEQHLLFTQRPLYHYSYAMPSELQVQEAAAWLRAKPQRYLLGAKAALERCFDVTKGEDLGNRHRTDWLLVDVSALKATCSEYKSTTPPFFYEPKWVYGQ